MISILIPVYNYDASKLIETLFTEAQKLQIPFEIILADDCSTDKKTIETNKNLEGKKLCQVLRNPTNKGRTYTRNLLAKTARFEQLLFLDADVLPKSADFIKNFMPYFSDFTIVFGGITYSEKRPEPNQILRWTYGKSREGRTAKERNKKPYLSLISGCCGIKKNVFLKINCHLENHYGTDVLLARNLEKIQATVKHIDNPVVHHGLENNSLFIQKTLSGLKNLADYSRIGKIPKDYRPIQATYFKLKKYHLCGFYTFLMRFLEPIILKNLLSKKPSLFGFDLFRLYHYVLLNR